MNNIYLFVHKHIHGPVVITELKDIIACYHQLNTEELFAHVDYKIIIGEQKLIYIQI